MTPLTLDAAVAIVDAALGAGRDHRMMPLTVAVLDAGGHLMAFKREDGSGIMRPEVAIGKAYGALGMGASTRLLRDRLADRPAFQAALAAASQGRFVPVPGGVLVRDAAGAVLGAVGISGDTSDRDEYCAIAGIKAAGFVPDPDDPAEDWNRSRL
jgi:uncharacterized protein GlcG (DUF336 family)